MVLAPSAVHGVHRAGAFLKGATDAWLCMGGSVVRTQVVKCFGGAPDAWLWVGQLCAPMWSNILGFTVHSRERVGAQTHTHTYTHIKLVTEEAVRNRPGYTAHGRVHAAMHMTSHDSHAHDITLTFSLNRCLGCNMLGDC